MLKVVHNLVTFFDASSNTPTLQQSDCGYETPVFRKRVSWARRSMASEAPIKPERAGNTGKLISSYYLEIEHLLDRVEQSNTYYQALAIERSATPEDVVRAYQETIKILHPPYYKVRAAISDDILERIDKSFSRVSQAFFVLTDHSRKVEYDRSLNRSGPVTPLPGAASVTPPVVEATEVDASPANADQEAISVRSSVAGQPVYSKP